MLRGDVGPRHEPPPLRRAPGPQPRPRGRAGARPGSRPVRRLLQPSRERAARRRLRRGARRADPGADRPAVPELRDGAERRRGPPRAAGHAPREDGPAARRPEDRLLLRLPPRPPLRGLHLRRPRGARLDGGGRRRDRRHGRRLEPPSRLLRRRLLALADRIGREALARDPRRRALRRRRRDRRRLPDVPLEPRLPAGRARPPRRGGAADPLPLRARRPRARARRPNPRAREALRQHEGLRRAAWRRSPPAPKQPGGEACLSPAARRRRRPSDVAHRRLRLPLRREHRPDRRRRARRRGARNAPGRGPLGRLQVHVLRPGAGPHQAGDRREAASPASSSPPARPTCTRRPSGAPPPARASTPSSARWRTSASTARGSTRTARPRPTRRSTSGASSSRR